MEQPRTSGGWVWARRAASPLLALLLHTVAVALLLAIPLRPISTTDLPPRSPEEHTVDLAIAGLEEAAGTPASPPRSTPESEPDQGTAPSRAPASASTQAAGARAAAGAVATSEIAPDELAARAKTTDQATGTKETGEAPAESGPIALTLPRASDIGLGGKNLFLPKSEAAVEAAESKRAVDRALRDPAREKERELGLGPEGPVLTALADGTSRSIAPVTGRAVFIATSNANGDVISMELADAEGGRPGWADAGKLALEVLKGKKLRVLTNSTRSVMRIEVTSAVKLPSGRDPGVDVTLFHIPIHKGAQGKGSAKISILDPIPKLTVHYLEVGGPGGAKIPIPTVQLNIFHAPIDPVDIGATPRRIIHTRLLDSKVM